MDCISSPDAEPSRQAYERKRLFPVLSQLLHERTEEYFFEAQTTVVLGANRKAEFR